MNWIKEEMKLMNMRKEYADNTGRNGDILEIFEIENELTLDEKVAFIDSMKDGVASYLIGLLTKWKEEKDSLSKDVYGEVRTVSKKAWIRKNDSRELLDNYFKYGSYRLFGRQYTDMTLETPTSMYYGSPIEHTGSHVANQWFHDILNELKRREEKYFRDNDTLTIKIKEVKEMASMSILFNSMELNDIVWNGKEDISEENLDVYIESYEKLGVYIEELEREVHSKIEVELIED